jgi:hypothetical protein
MMPNGKMGCSIWTDLDIIGMRIEGATWWNETFDKCLPMSVSRFLVDEDQTDFPIMVELTSGRIDYDDIQDDGDDIRFVNATCNESGVLIPHEVVKYNEGGSSYIFTNLPYLSASSDTKFSMYFENINAVNIEDPIGVWSPHGYTMVTHFEEPSGILEDKMQFHNGTYIGTGSTYEAVGIVGDAFEKASGDHIFNGNSSYSNFNATDNWSVEMWVLDTNDGQNAPVFGKQENTTGYGWIVVQQSNWLFMSYKDRSNNLMEAGITPDDDVFDGSWHYVVFTKSQLNTDLGMRVYLDGANRTQKKATGVHTDATYTVQDLRIGKSFWSEAWESRIDEFKISNQTHDTEYIDLQYESMNDNLITYGTVEDRPIPTPPPEAEIANFTMTCEFCGDDMPIYRKYCNGNLLTTERKRVACSNLLGCAINNQTDEFVCNSGCSDTALTSWGEAGCLENDLTLVFMLIFVIFGAVAFIKVSVK